MSRIKGVAILALGLAACAPKISPSTVERDPIVLGELQCLGVLPLSNETDEPDAGRMLSDLVSAELQANGRWDIRERWEIREFLGRRGINLGDNPTAAEVALVGQMLGVDAVLTGSVLEYTAGPGTYKAEDAGPIVGLRLKVREVKTGATLFVAEQTRASGDWFRFQRQPMTHLGLEILAPMVTAMTSELPDLPKAPECPPLPILPFTRKPAQLLIKKAADDDQNPKVVIVRVTKESGEVVELNIRDTRKIYFNPGRLNLSEASEEMLKEMHLVLDQNPRLRLLIEGHTDKNPGDDPGSNYDRSFSRAKSVFMYMVSRLSSHPKKMSVRGHGDTDPVHPNDTLLNKTLNRRVELKLYMNGDDV